MLGLKFCRNCDRPFKPKGCAKTCGKKCSINIFKINHRLESNSKRNIEYRSTVTRGLKNCVNCDRIFRPFGKTKCCSEKCMRTNKLKIQSIHNKTSERMLLNREYNKTPERRLANKIRKTSPQGRRIARKYYRISPLPRLNIDKYQASDKGKIAIKLWNKSLNGRASQSKRNKKFRSTKKGQETNLFHNRLRRARKNNLVGVHTFEDWLNLNKLLGNHCIDCWKKLPLTEDHIIPITPPKSIPSYMKGDNTKYNIAPKCKSCNSKKRNKYDVPILSKNAQIF